ncbi:hypothetical protein OIU79_025168 [Salix purpurea]|uniref:Uncharacterized protein n=1 Tax=Salix purpurea TaxID=77065 RepID=A0A9Q0W4I7_SALPP|nr:hypothetical protein OIU79_025168 [Salix purpurea]
MGASPFCEPTRILSFPSKAEVTEPSSFSLSSWELRSQTEPLTENPLASHSFILSLSSFSLREHVYTLAPNPASSSTITNLIHQKQ